jgi:hypothetical protein
MEIHWEVFLCEYFKNYIFEIYFMRYATCKVSEIIALYVLFFRHVATG